MTKIGMFVAVSYLLFLGLLTPLVMDVPPELKKILSTASGVVFVIGFVPYIRGMKRGKEPMKSSWLIWSANDTVAGVSMYLKHTLNGQITGAVLGAWVVTAFTFKYGKRGWELLDVICMLIGAAGVTLALIYKDATLGICGSLVALYVGSYPTVKSVWRNPKKEDPIGWTIFWISCLMAYFAIPKWTLEDAGQPITFLVVESVVVFILYFRRPFQPLSVSVAD